ncbi:hypothetical protein AHMF7605_27695 [Adhaeribacter arboris]|uniref:Secretion system C-terminal sorting domain-containing protein n=1 Tax=Adhaeribacter arboris TaxID=2072846 RepID=A0A2T2YNB4_9BACT|nr:hypothetical protein [Adhaeribacter arboris]PSR57000.1 hypothetical protein AHMF7605_27695 [Adhaeribacter arboris]
MKNMKNLVTALLFTLIVGISSVSFALPNRTTLQEQPAPATDLAVTFGHLQKSNLDVMVASVINARMTIRLYDATEKNIATKTLAKNDKGTLVRFDLTVLANGVYQVKVTDGKTTQQ